MRHPPGTMSVFRIIGVAPVESGLRIIVLSGPRQAPVPASQITFTGSHFPLPLRSPRVRSQWFRCVSQRRRGPLRYPCHTAGNTQSCLGYLVVVSHSIEPLAGCLDRPQLKLLEGDFHLLSRLHPEQLFRQSGVTFYVYCTFHSIYFSNFVP